MPKSSTDLPINVVDRSYGRIFLNSSKLCQFASTNHAENQVSNKKAYIKMHSAVDNSNKRLIEYKKECVV